MKLFTPPEPATPKLKIDWASPIIVFDPWPFKEQSIQTNACFINGNGDIDRALGFSAPFVLNREHNMMGLLTDGTPFVSNERGIKAWTEKSG